MGATIGDVITPGNEKAFTVKDKKSGALKDLPPQHKQLLSDPVTASLTTVSAKGEMQVTPVWVGNDGNYLELNSVRGRLKDRNLRANGKVREPVSSARRRPGNACMAGSSAEWTICRGSHWPVPLSACIGTAPTCACIGRVRPSCSSPTSD